MQAAEMIKFLLGLPGLRGRSLLMDLKAPSFSAAKLRRRENCPVCGGGAAIPAGADAALSVTPAELKSRLAAGSLILIDLRSDWEHGLVAIPGSSWMDLGRLAEEAGKLDLGAEYVLYCKSGKRSMQAVRCLKKRVSAMCGPSKAA